MYFESTFEVFWHRKHTDNENRVNLSPRMLDIENST